MRDKPHKSVPDAIAHDISAAMELNQLRTRVQELEKQAADPELTAIRATIIRELTRMLPAALRAARRGKPALLRLIIRSIRLR